MSLRRCAWHNCPQLVTQGQRYCKAHKHAYEQARGTATQRGYGKAHKQERARWARAMAGGATPTCNKCGKPITNNDDWDLGHTDNRQAWTGPEHRSCNRRDGQAKSTASQEHWKH